MIVDAAPSAMTALPGANATWRRVLAVSLGNGLEFYDFGVYALFAVYIGRAFFPARSGSFSLLLSVATFGIGFVTRPLGALILGRLGDRVGRRRAMVLCFLLMGAGTLLLAVTPPFARIGLAAPIMAVLSRLVQGFAVGGDVGPTTAYMVEASPTARRGLYGSMQVTTQQTATLAAALVGVGVAAALSPAALAAWGWRVAFLLGVVIVPFGLRLRSRLPETVPPPASDVSLVAQPPRLRPYMPVIICSLLLLVSGTISAYSLGYLATYALAMLHMAAGRAFALSAVASLGMVAGYLLSGWLSDHVGRRPMIRSGMVLTAVLVLPTFVLIGRHPSALLLYTAVGLLATCSGLKGPMVVALTEAVPAPVRSGVVAITYTTAVAIFGGSTQFIVTWLIHRSGSALAPAWYWSAALVVGIVAALYIPETAPQFARSSRACNADPAQLTAMEEPD